MRSDRKVTPEPVFVFAQAAAAAAFLEVVVAVVVVVAVIVAVVVDFAVLVPETSLSERPTILSVISFAKTTAAT